MAQLTDSCFDSDEALLPLEQAIKQLEENLSCLVEIESCSLNNSLNRILAVDIQATLNVPPHDNSAVDGYAVCFNDLSKTENSVLNVGERVAAGQFLDRPLQKNEAIRIFTGAPMPKGADTVMMQEDCTEINGKVTLLPGIKKGANSRDAGEDMKQGDILLHKGQRVSAAQIAVAAAQGLTHLSVYKKLKVALFSSGDEVNDPGTELPTGGIYDANRPMLIALLSGWGVDIHDLGILPDDHEQMTEAFLQAASTHDLLISSAGMSVGEEDHLCNVIKANGRMNFWKLAIKPGRPVGLGLVQRNGKSTPVLGLPGNPVAAFLTCCLLGRPLIQILCGTNISSPLQFPCELSSALKKKAGRKEYLRGIIKSQEGTNLPIVEEYGRRGAAILSSLQGADGFILLDMDVTNPEKGDDALFLPMEGLLTL